MTETPPSNQGTRSAEPNAMHPAGIDCREQSLGEAAQAKDYLGLAMTTYDDPRTDVDAVAL
jgi:hypothetical protein